MKKALLVFLLFCTSTCYTYSNWYGNHAVGYTSTSGTTNCSGDGDTTGGSHASYGEAVPANGNSSSTTAPISGGISAPTSGNLRCLHWDRQSPDNVSVTYTSGWHNASGTSISLSARDRGGAGIDRLVLQERVNGVGGYNTVQTWDNIGATNGGNVIRSWSKVPTSSEENDTFNYRIIATDDAGNSTTVTNTAIIQFDLTAPVLADINSPSPVNGTELLALNSQNFSISVNNAGGSPIHEVEGFFENYGTTNSYIATRFSSFSDDVSSTRNTLEISPNISDVDGDGTPTNGVRDYRFKITNICDQVGNCLTLGNNSGDSSGIVNYSYPVYANTTVGNLTVKTVTSSSRSDVQDTNNVADGTTHTLTLRLQDQFGNRVIPVSAIGREVAFDIDVYNTLYLNQFMRSGGSAAQIAPPSNPAIFSSYPLGNNSINSYLDQPSSDGQYDFGFKLYTPTNHYDINGGADPLAAFQINSIDLSIDHDAGFTSWNTNQGIDNSSGIDFQFAPMFQTDFTGELDDNGLIEGLTQSSDIALIKNSSRITGNASFRKMYLKYNGDATDLTNLDLLYSQSNPPTSTVGEGPTLVSDIPSGSFGVTSYNLFTRLEQVLGSTIGGIESTYLSSHLSYTIDGQNVVLNSDVIGRDNYYDTIAQSSTTQAGVKILGLSNATKTQELITGQFTDDVRVIGRLTKVSFRKDISERVYTLTRTLPDTPITPLPIANNLSGNSWSTTGNNGQIILDDSVIVYKNIGGRYVSIGNTNGTINGKKTIVIIGGDGYIRDDITNGGPQDILGIIALKDSDGRGGNIFIDHEVIDVDAILYAEKTIMTTLGDSNPDTYIDITSNEVITSTTSATELSNQLYIYGSVFSENTIGGSRASPIKCPYYETCIDSEDAQKYDLNYMRRYVRIDTDSDSIPDTVANGGSMSSRSTVGGNEDFPLVIQYNPTVQSSPPPLFK